MKIKIDRNSLLFFLTLYVIGIFIWDYTIVYQFALVVLFALTLIFYKGSIVNNTYLVGSYTLLFVYFVLHTLMVGTTDWAYSTRYLLTMGINLAALICLGKVLTTREKIEYIMKVCIWVTLAVCIYIIVIEATNLFSGALSWRTYKPFTSEGYGHNEVAILAAMSTLFLVYFKIERIHFPARVFLIVFFSVFVVLTGARRSFLLSLVALFVYPLLFPQLKETTAKNLGVLFLKAFIAIATVLFIFFVLLENEFLYEIIGHRFEGFFAGLFGDEYLESSAISRDTMLEAALALVSEKPLLGHGLNTFRTFDGSFSTWSHNNYFELWVSGGILPVVIYYSIYVRTLIKLSRVKNDKLAGMFFSYMLFALANDFIAVTFVGRVPLFMLAMADAYVNNMKHEINHGKSIEKK